MIAPLGGVLRWLLMLLGILLIVNQWTNWIPIISNMGVWPIVIILAVAAVLFGFGLRPKKKGQ